MVYKLTIACLSTGLCSVALAQARPQSAATTTTGPSAWVYVSSMIGTTEKSDVYGFTAASNGKLTPIAGSPFPADLTSMAVNGVYLFGAPLSGSMIDTYRIQSNGALTYAASTNESAPNKCSNTPGPVFLDHTGASLYDFYYWGDSICSNSVYQGWNVVKSTGALTYNGSAGGDEELTGVLTFIGNNQFGYTTDCYHSDGQISGFKRNSDGSLTLLNLAQVWPKAQSGQFYCPFLAAADPTNHLAIPLFPCAGGPCGGPAGTLAGCYLYGERNNRGAEHRQQLCEHAEGGGWKRNGSEHVAIRQAACGGGKQWAAGVPLQWRESGDGVHRVDVDQRDGSDLLGQRQPPVRDWNEREQAGGVHGDSDELDLGGDVHGEQAGGAHCAAIAAAVAVMFTGKASQGFHRLENSAA